MSTSPSPIKHTTLGRSILSVVGLFTSTGCYMADFNASHVYNPTWPPHAKFHNGQTMSLGLLLGACTLYYLHRSPYSRDASDASSLQSSSPPTSSSTTSSTVPTPGKTGMTTAAAALERAIMDLDTAALLGSLYWITQASGYLYPGTDGGMPDNPLGQLYLSTGTLCLVAFGWWTERKRLRSGAF